MWCDAGPVVMQHHCDVAGCPLPGKIAYLRKPSSCWIVVCASHRAKGLGNVTRTMELPAMEGPGGSANALNRNRCWEDDDTGEPERFELRG